MLGKLTDTAIRNAKPSAKPYRISDGGGMYLEISPAGGKLWRLKYRFGGKEKRLALGVYPDVTLAKARERRDEARRLLADGVDPGQLRKASKAEAVAQGDTFEKVAREWHQRFLSGWTPDHAAKILTSLESNAFPWIGHRPIREILPPDILSVARRVEARGAVETAHRLVGSIGQVFRYAVSAGRADSDPSRDLRGALAPTNEEHYPTITDQKEIGALLRALDAYTGRIVVRSALRILPYVFTRPGELRGMEWVELDLEGEEPTWTIPAERMKARRKHIVALSPQVVSILKDLLPVTGSGRLVFPGDRSPERPFSNVTLGVALVRLGYGKDTIVPHGFRSMASTLLNEMGYNADWIEAQLAHKLGGIRGAYNHAAYLPERRKMMQAWADYLDALRDGGKVVPLFKATAGE